MRKTWPIDYWVLSLGNMLFSVGPDAIGPINTRWIRVALSIVAILFGSWTIIRGIRIYQGNDKERLSRLLKYAIAVVMLLALMNIVYWALLLRWLIYPFV